MSDFLRLQLLRKLDKEKILDVSHYENILLKAFENVGFSENKKPSTEADFYRFYNGINAQIDSAEIHLEEARQTASKIVDSGNYTNSEKQQLKTVVRKKFQELFNFFDSQKDMAKTIFDDEFRVFIRRKYFTKIDKNKKLDDAKKDKLFDYIYTQARYNTNISNSFDGIGEKTKDYVAHLENVLQILY